MIAVVIGGTMFAVFAAFATIPPHGLLHVPLSVQAADVEKQGQSAPAPLPLAIALGHVFDGPALGRVATHAPRAGARRMSRRRAVRGGTIRRKPFGAARHTRCLATSAHEAIFAICGVLVVSAYAFARPNESATTYQDIQKTLGFVPAFVKAFPEDAITGAWDEMKAIQISPTTALPDPGSSS